MPKPSIEWTSTSQSLLMNFRPANEYEATALLIESDPHAEPFYLACGATRIGELPAPIAGLAERVCYRFCCSLSLDLDSS